MAVEKIKTFDEVMAYLYKEKRTPSLLMGNGFSRAFDDGIFSYNALFDFMVSKRDDLIDRLFDAIKTKNFELIMQQLDTTIVLLDAFGADEKLKNKITEARDKIKSELLSAIQSLHPEHVFKVTEERSTACAKFLSAFLENGGQIFTTNYDLLLYWVLMRQGISNPIDGFGRELLNPDEVEQGQEQEWSDLLWG